MTDQYKDALDVALRANEVFQAEVERLSAEGGRKDKLIESLTAANTDRWDAWWEMRDEFESGGAMARNRILKIIDSYETIEMDQYRKARDPSVSGSQEAAAPDRRCCAFHKDGGDTYAKCWEPDTRRRTWWCPQCSAKSDDDGIVRDHKESCCHYGSALAPPATAADSRQSPGVPKHDDKMHPNRYERHPLETTADSRQTTEIPPMTSKLSKHWGQPERSEIRITDGTAYMNEGTLTGLADYSMSIPSGVYAGKMWRRKIHDGWQLCWYVDSEKPDHCDVVTRQIEVRDTAEKGQ